MEYRLGFAATTWPYPRGKPPIVLSSIRILSKTAVHLKYAPPVALCVLLFTSYIAFLILGSLLKSIPNSERGARQGAARKRTTHAIKLRPARLLFSSY